MMKSMVLDRICDLNDCGTPLKFMDLPAPSPGPEEILIKIKACGICHTELDEIEGRTSPPIFPVIPGHQVVGLVAGMGTRAEKFSMGQRVGVAWIFSACGGCRFCKSGRENLCPEFKATGRDANGGYAEYMTVPENFAFLIPETFSDNEAAPLLCAGAIGYRSLRLTGIQNGDRLGLTGFGASAHLVMKMARHLYPDTQVFVFARNETEREFARHLGAVWAGDTEDPVPEKLDAIIDTTPAWKPVVLALNNLDAGGRLVINAIRKENGDKNHLLSINYPAHLWMEKEIKSVANITSQDVREFLLLAADMNIRPEIQAYDLKDANRALMELKKGHIRGAKVLVMD
ncbi:MAG: zinc-dependent alcohol dehydrogenase family protein [Desulfosalsimonadaceae bacterium]|nr:zinc-dependent alcohol dehydrogenase family protein [Desulfosalsimonadaceae bacterium]